MSLNDKETCQEPTCLVIQFGTGGTMNM